jgi:hypothetical protein
MKRVMDLVSRGFYGKMRWPPPGGLERDRRAASSSRPPGVAAVRCRRSSRRSLPQPPPTSAPTVGRRSAGAFAFAFFFLWIYCCVVVLTSRTGNQTSLPLPSYGHTGPAPTHARDRVDGSIWVGYGLASSFAKPVNRAERK